MHYLVWKKEIAPDDWSKVVLLSVPKKRGKTYCDNHRGISLLDLRESSRFSPNECIYGSTRQQDA